MASNLLELRKAAGYRNANDFAEAHKIPASTYARYESNPDKIPMDRAWQLADILGTTIDASPAARPRRRAPRAARCSSSTTPHARGARLMDEFREFVRQKDERIRARKRREEERPYEALCYQYEQQMLSQMREAPASASSSRSRARRPRAPPSSPSCRSRRRRSAAGSRPSSRNSTTTPPLQRSWRRTTARTASSSMTA